MFVYILLLYVSMNLLVFVILLIIVLFSLCLLNKFKNFCFVFFFIINSIFFCVFESIILYGEILGFFVGIWLSFKCKLLLFLVVILDEDEVKLVVFIFCIFISLLKVIVFNVVFISFLFINGFLICIEGFLFLFFLVSFLDVNVVLWILLCLVFKFIYIMELLIFLVVFFWIILWLMIFIYIVLINGLLL